MLLREPPKIWPYSIHTYKQDHPAHTHHGFTVPRFFKKFPFAMEEKQFQAESKDNQ